MLVVAALGGNALLRRGEPLESEIARRNAKVAAEALSAVAREHKLVITHGNGPQVGLLALQNESYRDVRSYPLDVLGAESEGMIGYVLEQELGNALPGYQVASLLTETVVDASDPAFDRPSKPIGPTYTAVIAQRLASERGWVVAPDGCDASGKERWRRVVASPVPRSIVELPTIQLLLDHGVIVICAGGGGIPVVVDAHGARYGVEAVVDKDLATALIAEELGADLLVLLTDVAAVELDWGTPDARPLHQTTVRELHEYEFAPGSMGPKVAAAMSFVTSTGRPAAIGALADAAAVVNGTAGTIVRSST
ncbi:MAG TPA: carbamate kinase [Acidimicrobiia bacterium]|jgi:carbamate kinase|nr:carbamate kinase [Acidimicrobiia bacterium]